MTSYYENREREHGRNAWVGFIVLALSVPLLFFGLDALLTWIARLVA